MIPSNLISKSTVGIRTHGENEEHLRELAASATSSRLQRRGRRREVQEHHPLLPIAVVPDAPGEAGASRAAHEADGDDAVMGGGPRCAGCGCRGGGG